ncbi:unnamed protein product [Euphydryas editha]|uniref:Uncharacterized protein n=1 Tax=Euphydryas editha TaxID=104508 RepID=A0AAU9V004_EUPED|nr:unnamed protein product [Euphydryas editha]
MSPSGLHARHDESRWRLRAGAWQGRRRGSRALALGVGCSAVRVHSRGALLGSFDLRTRECGAYAECGRPHFSPSEAGLNARRRRAAGGRARAHQVYGYDREAGPLGS